MNGYLNIFTLTIGFIVMLIYIKVAYRVGHENPNSIPKVNKTILLVIVASHILQMCIIAKYEIYMVSRGNVQATSESAGIAQEYFNTIAFNVFLSLFVNEKATRIIWFVQILSLMLWFHNAYFRIIIFACIVPCYEGIMFVYSYIFSGGSMAKVTYEKLFISNMFYFNSICLYFIFLGTTITNVNIRAGERANYVQMGEFYINTGFIYAITKYSLQILSIAF